jgi:hypothetical protein
MIGAMNMELKLPPSVPVYKPTDYFSNPIADGKVVKLPVLPGLRAYPKEKTMVQYRGFVEGIPSDMRQDYMVKALILH